MSYEDYLKGVLIKLSRDGFEIERNIKIGNYDVDVFAISPTFEPSPGFMYDSLELLLGKHPYRLAIIVARMPAVAIETIDDYSKATYDYAYPKIAKSNFFHRAVFPVIASEKFAEDVKSHVVAYDGIRRRFPGGDFTRPVLVELDTKQSYSNSSENFSGYRLRIIVNKAVEKYLTFSNSNSELKDSFSRSAEDVPGTSAPNHPR